MLLASVGFLANQGVGLSSGHSLYLSGYHLLPGNCKEIDM